LRRLRLCLALLPVLLLAAAQNAAADPPPIPNPLPVIPEAKSITVATDQPYAGDAPKYATVSPNADGYRG
jgi:hypothetical protein